MLDFDEINKRKYNLRIGLARIKVHRDFRGLQIRSGFAVYELGVGHPCWRERRHSIRWVKIKNWRCKGGVSKGRCLPI